MTFPPHQPGNFARQERARQERGRAGRSGLIIGIGVTVVAVVLVATGTLILTGEHAIAGRAQPRAVQDFQPRPGAGQDVRAARELAGRFAAALSADSAAPLVKISCAKPNRAEIEAFDTEAARYDHTFTVTEPPTVRGEVATGKMRGRVGELTFTLHRRGSGWCAEYQWSGLVR